MKTNDTKYTEEYVLNELQILLDTLRKDKSIVYIWELFEWKEYGRQRYSEWVNKYWSNEEIKKMSDTLKDELETRAVKWLLNNKLNAAWTIFHLKNNYKRVDKQEIDQTTTNINLNKDVSELTDKELDEALKKFGQ